MARRAAWNETRVAAGEEPVEIGVGVHFGEVIVGNVGDARRLEYTVLGDAVNVGVRLERVTRELRVPIVVSGDLVEAVRGRPGADALLASLDKSGVHTLRGREAEIDIWASRHREPVASYPAWISTRSRSICWPFRPVALAPVGPG